MGILALEVDAFGHHGPSAAVGGQVLSIVVHKKHLAALGLHREEIMRPDPSLRRHDMEDWPELRTQIRSNVRRWSKYRTQRFAARRSRGGTG